MAVASAVLSTPVDANSINFQDGFNATIVSAAAITVTDSTAVFQLPFMNANGKVKLVVEISALSGGTSPTLTVTYQETVDGTNFNAAALTSGSLNATGNTWSAVASGPVFNQGKLVFTVGGTGSPTFTVSVSMVAWNK